jgi:alkylation response protein AidB-like acyl-CoA dehydrogenase
MTADVLAEFGSFLDACLPPDYTERYAEYRKDVRLRADYQVAAFEAGWLVPDWEPEYGGQNLTRADALELRIEGARRQVPQLLNIQGVGVVAPALQRFGTPEQKERLLRPVLRGDEWWALGMSEPGSGSDLASLRTRARRVGDQFVINGQKIWTTQARQSRWCTLYARTDPDAPRHAGISCFVLDLDSPGVDIRPIRRAAEVIDDFCEVFLDGVAVPAANLLGPLNQGWRVAIESLDHERDMIWIHNWVDIERMLGPVCAQTSLAGASSLHAGRLLADSAALRFTGLRTALGRMRGVAVPEFFVLKLLGSETLQSAARLALELGGVEALTTPELFDERFESLGATLYGGTSEIQRDLIAEKALGLPRTRSKEWRS